MEEENTTKAERMKQYLHDYHQRMRKENADRLQEYRQTQIEKGNNYTKYARLRRERKLQDEQ